LEYIIVDGGSSDETVKILESFGKKILWISEKDRGQSEAINKGLKMATGEVLGYLNSDDYLEKDALRKIGEFFSKKGNAYWLTGKCYIVDENSRECRKLITSYKNFLLRFLRSREIFNIVQFISQPSTFWRKEVLTKIGYFDETLHYDMDYDYWLRIWQKYRLYFLDDYLSSYRVHKAAKAVVSPETQFKVEFEIVRRYTNSKIILLFHKFHARLVLMIYRLFFY
jgi:glycosyltransferase involved in cell wall biosynthesis